MLRSIRHWISRRKCRTPLFPLLLLLLVTANVLMMGFKTLSIISAEEGPIDYQEMPQGPQVQNRIRKMLRLSSTEEKQSVVEGDGWVQQNGQEMSGVEAMSRYQKALTEGLPRLAGVHRPQKGFLTIGIPSVPRPGVTYLYQTMDSIINQTTPEQRDVTTVVIYLASFQNKDILDTFVELEKRYGSYINSGFLHIIRALPDTYPSLNIRKRNYKDNYERIRWRSKQVVDYAYLFTYAKNISEYYLQLEDDVLCAQDFVGAIKSYINSVHTYWVTLHFSDLGYIGKLHRSSELSSIATFYMLFYYEEPVDFLLPDYENLRHQENKFLRKPTLFQHMGRKSSHRGLENKLFDVYFESVAVRRMADNPDASLYTDIRVFQRHKIGNAYEGQGKFFWGVSPRSGNFVLVVLHKPVKVFRVVIHTGSPRISNDFLRHGVLQAAPSVQGEENSDKRSSCDSSYVDVGQVKNAVVDTGNNTKSLNFPVKCLRLSVTRGQNNWIIIRSISVFTRDTENY